MNRAIFALFLGLATAPAAAQPNPDNRAAASPSQAPIHECEPYPECLVIDSPLRPGAPGIGIRDNHKALRIGLTFVDWRLGRRRRGPVIGIRLCRRWRGGEA